MNLTHENHFQYERMASAIRYLVENAERQPSLDEAAANVGLSSFHFQKLFSAWVGVSPKTFLEVLTARHAKERLARSESVLDAALGVGLSGPGRLHDLLVSIDGITPGEYKKAAREVRIDYGVHDTIYGRMLMGQTERGVCYLHFFPGSETNGEGSAEARLLQAWPQADLRSSPEATLASLELAGLMPEREGRKAGATGPLRLFVKGSPFQLKVWQALIAIPEGDVCTYGRLAAAIGDAKAARAVGSAVGKNEVALLIPCHRVIRESGVVHSYRWGESTKKMVLAREFCRRS